MKPREVAGQGAIWEATHGIAIAGGASDFLYRSSLIHLRDLTIKGVDSP